MINRLIKTSVATFIVFFACAMVMFVTMSHVSAGGGVGGGGSGGGCMTCGGSSTDYGYGWYKYSTVEGAEAPGGMRDGSSYWDVRNFCRDTGNDSVIAFIIQTSSRSPGTANVYQYVSGSYNKYYDYKGDDGGNWLTHEDAASLYYSLPPGLRDGWTWGSNVAWFCYDFSKNWDIRGESYIEKGATPVGNRVQGTINAKPGDGLFWYHDLRNIGPDGMDKQVYFNIDRTGFSNGWNTIHEPSGYASGGYNQLFVTAYASSNSAYTLYTVSQSDVGNTLCARISWIPKSSSYGDWWSSGFACANIPYDYNLTPTISATRNNAEAGATFQVSPTVNNAGPTKSKPTDWIVYRFILNPGDTIPLGGPSSQNGNIFYGHGAKSVAQGSGQVFVNGNTSLSNLNEITPDIPVGSRVCYGLSVRPYNQSTGDAYYSDPRCVVIAKVPKVDILGGDLYVGRKPIGLTASVGGSRVLTRNSSNTAGMFGSWAEYAIIPTGPITAMSSGSGHVGGNAPQRQLLSFANAYNSAPCTDTNPGCYSQSYNLPSIASRFPTSTATPTFSGGSLGGEPAGTHIYKGSGNISISGSTIPLNHSIIINAPTANVTITGNITYSSATLSSLSEIPQVVIIANSITIASSVTNVDAWLIAPGNVVSGSVVSGGVIRTCDVAVSALSASVCNQQLRINGPVVANQLSMLRTAGAGTGSEAGQPAEIFNFRPDAYLWANNQSISSGRVMTIISKELPPKY